jgi:hypothetical protein
MSATAVLDMLAARLELGPLLHPLPVRGESDASEALALEHYVAWVRLKGGHQERMTIGHFADEDSAATFARGEAVRAFGSSRVEGVSVLARPA